MQCLPLGQARSVEPTFCTADGVLSSLKKLMLLWTTNDPDSPGIICMVLAQRKQGVAARIFLGSITEACPKRCFGPTMT